MVRKKAQGRSSGNHSSASSSSSTILSSDRSSRTEVVVLKGRTRRRVNRVEKEIYMQRRSTKLQIPKAPFSRLLRSIVVELYPRLKDDIRIQAIALEALQEAAEMYIVQFFEDATQLTIFAKRLTLMQRDMVLLRYLRGRDDVINR